MAKPRVFVSFDIADLDVKESFVAQSKLTNCPFDLVDTSLVEAVPKDWVKVARARIEASDWVVVVCGEQTHQATGVATELQIAQELKKKYFLLRGTRVGAPTAPKHARKDDKIWTFRWPTIETLLAGGTPPDDAACSH